MADNELTEAEDQFFESGGEAPVEDIEETPEEPVEAAAEEPAEEPEEDDRKVPYGAMHEERQRRKEEAAARQAAEERAQRMEERFQQMLAMQQQPQEEPLPDFDEDPAEYLRRMSEQTGATVQQLQHHIQQQQAQQQHAQQRDQFLNQYKSSATQYASEHPEFTDAYRSLVEGRVNEYRAAGYDENLARQFVEQDEIAIAAKAFQDGVNPAERIVELAKVRGWTGAKKTESGAENVDRVRRGQAAGKSLSGSAGKREGAMTLESLAEMDDEEFAEKWDAMIGVKKSVLG